MLPTIKKHAKGDTVKIAQILIEFADVSGEFDSLFETAVKSFQSKHGLSMDGVIGPRTWTEIAKVAPKVSIKSLRQGKYALAVQLLVGVEADGIFGKQTKAAVVAYQSAAGLTADGARVKIAKGGQASRFLRA